MRPDRELLRVAGYYDSLLAAAPNRSLRRAIKARRRLFVICAHLPPERARLLYTILAGLEAPLYSFLAGPGTFGAALDAIPQGEARIDHGITYLTIQGDITPALLERHRAAIQVARYLHVTIDSMGGDALSGLELFHTFRARPDTIATVRRVCASAATFALQGCRTRLMEEGSLVMVHSPRHSVFGPLATFQKAMTDLKRCQQIAGEALQRCQQNNNWFDGADHWFNASQAVKAGLVDEVVPPAPKVPALPDSAAKQADPDIDAEELMIALLTRLRGEFKDKSAFETVLKAFSKL
ncbi:MAG: ATP-dependent Clp protease proteolytic subunit [Limisphaerales bacterium]